MARTSTPASENGLENWFLAHQEAKRQGALPIRPPEVQNFINFLWPAAMDYYSPLNPIFLTECLSDEQMNRLPVWLVRDGLVPLLWFFRTNPTPEGFKGKLLIHEDFVAFVPAAWVQSIGSYRVESQRQAATKPKKLLLMGVAMDTFCSTQQLEFQLNQLTEIVGKQELGRREVHAFILGKYDGFGNEHHHEFFSDFVVRICDKLGTKIRCLNWRHLDAIDSYEDYDVVEFNERLLLVDSFMLHHPMSRGARLIETSKPSYSNGSAGEFIRLSPFHGMRVRQNVTISSSLEEQRKTLNKGLAAFSRFEEAMRSETNKRFPWPAWFTQWSRTSARPKK